MFGFELREELPRWPGLSFARVLQALPDSLICLGACGDIEQPLIGLRVLYNSCRLALHGQHNWPLALLELLYEIAGSPAESSERMNILRDVKHKHSPVAPF